MMLQQHRDKVGYNYKRIAQIGQGNYGSVFLYKRKNSNADNTFTDFFLNHKNPDSEYFALKRYKQTVKNRGVDFSALRQINLLSTMVHPNIVTAHQIFVDSIGSRKDITVVMDFHLQLTDILKNQSIFSSQIKKRLICYQMVKGLAYMHEHHIFHRDLKPHNIFVSRKGDVKIGDFGFSKQFGTPHKKYTPEVCTKQYRAPQLFFGTNYYTEKTDIWSLGCLFYYVYKKQTLFDSYNPSDLDILARIFALTGTPNQKNWPNFEKFPKFIKFTQSEGHNLHKQRNMDQDISDLIHLCISLDPSKRPTAKELLKHKFFTIFPLEQESLDVNEMFEEKLQKIIN